MRVPKPLWTMHRSVLALTLAQATMMPNVLHTTNGNCIFAPCTVVMPLDARLRVQRRADAVSTSNV